MEIRSAASSALRDLLDGPPRPAVLLGAGPYAIYLEVSGRVLAVVSRDAVRLPCSVVVPGPLPSPRGECRVGAGAVSWPTAAVTLRAVRYWRPVRVPASGVSAVALRPAIGPAPIGVPDELIDALEPTAADAARALLGRGPGLTPSGDDVLAGFLLGARAFGVAVGPVRAEVGRHAATATSALSAQLLRHALAGECVPEVLPALARGELRPLLRVGRTSGAALARGLLRAAEVRDGLVAAA